MDEKKRHKKLKDWEIDWVGKGKWLREREEKSEREKRNKEF